MNEQTEVMRELARHSTGHAKFYRLAVIRTKAAIKPMRLLARMGRSRVFEYSSEEAEKIVGALEKELDEVKRGLAEPNRQTDIEFDL